MINEENYKSILDDSFDDTKDLEDIFLSDDEYDKIKEEFGIDLKDLEEHFKNYTPKQDLIYTKESPFAVDPKYAYESDSGFDLFSIENVTIPALDRKLISTGLKFDIPENYEIQIRPKSGLALNLGLTVLNTPGTIDQGYNGEIKVILFNTSQSPVEIKTGMKIAQAVLCPVTCGKWVNLVEASHLKNKDRNESGFGSTGIHL